MEQDFYTGRMREHGLDVIVPGREDRRIVHDVIYDELCRGVIKDASRERVPPDHARARATTAPRAILLGCTEIDLLVGPQDSPVPVFDTTRLHAERAVSSAWR